MKEQHLALLQEASNKIKTLRRQNELQAARLEVFDSMMRLFHTSPNGSGMGYEPAIEYEIDKYLAASEQSKD